MKILVTGSHGLIGAEAVRFYDENGHEVIGVDNNMRANLFGQKGDTSYVKKYLNKLTNNYINYEIDIRDKKGISKLFKENHFDLIIHCAAQPSHDKAREIPLLDFEINALGTIILLEETRINCPNAVFVYFSTNKVYGDNPNKLSLIELDSRYDYKESIHYDGADAPFAPSHFGQRGASNRSGQRLAYPLHRIGKGGHRMFAYDRNPDIIRDVDAKAVTSV